MPLKRNEILEITSEMCIFKIKTMKLKIYCLLLFAMSAWMQAQENPLWIHDSFDHVEEKLNIYPVPLDAGDEILTASKDESSLTMEYKQKSADSSLMEFYTCKSLKKGEFLTEVKGNLILKSKSENEQGISIEISEGVTSTGKKVGGKDIASRGVLEQDLHKFILK